MKIPHKQSIPIILSFALVMWACCALTYSSAKNFIKQDVFNNFLPYILILSLILIFIIIVFLLIRKKIVTWTCLVIAALLGFCISLICSNNLNTYSSELEKKAYDTYNFEILEDQKAGSYYNSCNAKIINNNFEDIQVKLQLPLGFEETHAGDIINADVKFIMPADTQIDNYWQNAIAASARASRAEKITRKDPIALIFSYRNHLIDTIRNYDWSKDNNAPSQAEQLLCAIICGQRIDLNCGDLYDSFKCDGLAHLIAVSGAHLSLVCAILLIILRKLKLKKWTIVFIQSIFIFAYLICAAVPISALRAALMTYIAIFSFFSKRRPAPLNALGICIIVLITLNAQTSVSISFALSAASTLGIILFSKLFEYWILQAITKCPEFISSALALTFSANICSLPLSISIFNQLPLISPLANIICTPIFSLLCGWGLVACVFTSIFYELLPLISQIFMFTTYLCSETLARIVRLLSSLPYASIPATINTIFAIILSATICIILYITWPTKIPKIKIKFKSKKFILITTSSFLLLLLFIILIPKNSDTELVMLDVAQGDSILLKSKGKNFIIDTGNQDNMLKLRLAEQNISHLDGLIITHPDDDHCGSLDVIEQLVAVDKVYLAKDLLGCSEQNCQRLMSNIRKIVDDTNIEKLNVGDKIAFGEIELDVIWPDKYKDNGGNCDSLCVIANVDIANDDEIDARALLCGDAEYAEIEEMQKRNRIPTIDIYKCGHHGSKNALSDKSASMMRPKITLISVGEKNRYGHPAQTTIDKLKNVDSLIYRTDKQGTITAKFSSTKINISTSK